MDEYEAPDLYDCDDDEWASCGHTAECAVEGTQAIRILREQAEADARVISEAAVPPKAA